MVQPRFKPVVLNSDSSASVVAGDAKAVADTTSIEGITDSSFAIASDLRWLPVFSPLIPQPQHRRHCRIEQLDWIQQGIELADVASC